MAQGIIGGATSYEEQSLIDIKADIENWINYTKEMHDKMEAGISALKACGFWDQVPFNFQMTLYSTLKCQESYLHDFSLILDTINTNKVTEREVTLLRKIGIKAVEFNHEYGRTFKEEHRWKKYGEPDFIIAEELYGRERDYFVTLQDASNAASRLNDYVTASAPVTYNTITQTVTGNSNIIAGINSGQIVQNISISEFKAEIDQAKDEIRSLDDVSPEIKEFILELLHDTESAVASADTEKQSQCKKSFKGFLVGAGAKAFKVIGVLSSFASIASFFGITL